MKSYSRAGLRSSGRRADRGFRDHRPPGRAVSPHVLVQLGVLDGAGLHPLRARGDERIFQVRGATRDSRAGGEPKAGEGA